MKKLEWNKGKGLSIDILTSKLEKYSEGKPVYDKNTYGSLTFTDKKDVVRFVLHVAKELGIRPTEYAKLANKVINEMGDWN